VCRAIAVVLLASFPLGALAQTSDLGTLRAKAQAEGSVEVRVVTRAAASTSTVGTIAVSSEQRNAMRRAQDRVLIALVSHGLVVGNEIFVQPDGTFSLRVLPEGLEAMARNTDIQQLTVAGPRQGEVSK